MKIAVMIFYMMGMLYYGYEFSIKAKSFFLKKASVEKTSDEGEQ